MEKIVKSRQVRVAGIPMLREEQADGKVFYTFSIWKNKKLANAAEAAGAKLEYKKELHNAYGSHHFWRNCDRIATLPGNCRDKFKKIWKGKKPTKPLTEEEKRERWCRRLSELTGISEAKAKNIANEKEEYQQNQINNMIERGNNSPGSGNTCFKMAKKIERENPLRYIKNKGHAEAILAASNRHKNTDYEDRLDEGRGLVAAGELEPEDVRDYARSTYAR